MRQSSRSDDDGRPFSVSQYCYGFFLERENVKRRLMRRDPQGFFIGYVFFFKRFFLFILHTQPRSNGVFLAKQYNVSLFFFFLIGGWLSEKECLKHTVRLFKFKLYTCHFFRQAFCLTWQHLVEASAFIYIYIYIQILISFNGKKDKLLFHLLDIAKLDPQYHLSINI